MATIIRRGSYQFQAKIRLRGYPARSATFASKSEAQEWAHRLEAEMVKGRCRESRLGVSTPFGEAIERYRREITPTKRGCVQEGYRLDQLMASDLAAMPLIKITGQDVAEYRDRRLSQVTPQTVNRDLNLIGHVFEIARKEWGYYLPENPVQQIRRPKSAESFRDRRLAPQDEAKLLAAASKHQNPYLEPLFVMAVETAARRGELLGIAWNSIDLANRTMTLAAGGTKNGCGRSVPLSTRAIAVLKRMSGSDGPVFPITPSQVRNGFAVCLCRAGLAGIRFHDLRHEAVSRFFEKGLDAMEVSSISGHKTMAMLRRYTHLQARKLALKLG